MPPTVETIHLPAADGLDPITVQLRHYGENRGGLLVECYGLAWLCYWGNMGSPSVRRFLHGVSPDYVANCLIAGRRAYISSRRAEAREAEYLERITAAVLRHLASHPEAAPAPEAEDLDKQLAEALSSLSFYKRRCAALQECQSSMRDPERTMVCDILANGSLLIDGRGQLAAERYAAAPTPAPTIDLAGHHYDPQDLLRRAVRNLKAKRRGIFWATVCDTFATGSTVARALSEWAGRDPETGDKL